MRNTNKILATLAIIGLIALTYLTCYLAYRMLTWRPDAQYYEHRQGG